MPVGGHQNLTLSPIMPRTRATTTPTTTVDPAAIFAAEQQARLEAQGFSSLYDTVTAYFFSSYGYPRWVATSVVSKESIREACTIVVEVTSSRIPIYVVDDNCTLDEVGRQLRAFVTREEYHYFRYYVAVALPLIVLAIIFNALAVTAVCRIRRRQPRHAIAISLSVSDVILSATTLIKRCGAVEVEDGPLTYPIVRKILSHSLDINIFWQAAFAMSALGLVCMAADNFVAVAAPFSYGQFSSSSWFVAVMPVLWGVVLLIMLGLRLGNLNHSIIVQHIVAAIICTLLFVILSAYGFTCFQALLFRRRADQWAQPEQKITMRRRLLKGFLTTTLLVLTCLLSWGPLVCYLLVDEEVVNAAHPVFLKFLLFCLVMFHLGAVLNPLIYTMRIRGIRISLFQMLRIPTQQMNTNGYPSVTGNSIFYNQQRRQRQSTTSCCNELPPKMLHLKSSVKARSAARRVPNLDIDFKDDVSVANTAACNSPVEDHAPLSVMGSLLGPSSPSIITNNNHHNKGRLNHQTSHCVDESVGPDTPAAMVGTPIVVLVPEKLDGDVTVVSAGDIEDAAEIIRGSKRLQKNKNANCRLLRLPNQQHRLSPRSAKSSNNNKNNNSSSNDEEDDCDDECGLSDDDDDDDDEPEVVIVRELPSTANRRRNMFKHQQSTAQYFSNQRPKVITKHRNSLPI